METIAQKLNIKEFPFEINDKNGKLIYHEKSNGFWCRYERDENGKIIYYKDSASFWQIYERDSKGDILYYEDSDGEIIDNRTTLIP